MMRVRPQVIIHDGDLRRRVLRFYFIDHLMVLNEDADEVRETKRHKWKTKCLWSRLDARRTNVDRRDVPESAIEQALQQGRDSLVYESQ